MRCAVIDIGSNTIKCSLFRTKNGRILLSGYKSLTACLLGYVFDGVMSRDGTNALCDAVCTHVEFAKKHGFNRVCAFATASLRALRDPSPVIDEVKARTGVDIILISGKDEASLSFEGMMLSQKSPVSGRACMADMGGGSTEVIFFGDGALTFSRSYDFGALILKNKFVKGDYPTREEAQNIREYCRGVIGSAPFSGKANDLYLVGGTAKSAARLLFSMRREKYPDEPVLTSESFFSLVSSLLTMKVGDKTESAVAALMPDRRKILLPGMLGLCEVICASGSLTLHIASGGLREGIAARLMNLNNRDMKGGK